MNHQDLHYPNLDHCSIILTAGSASSSNVPPACDAVMNPTCHKLMTATLPQLYDFKLEKSILNKKEQSSKKTLRQSISDSSEPDSNSKYTPDQRASLLRMKSITNASEGVCSSILQQKGFNLEPSIEAYFKGDYDSKA